MKLFLSSLLAIILLPFVSTLAFAQTFTAGSVIYSSGSAFTEDNANFFWNDTNHRLGIGTTTPQSPLHVFKASTAVSPSLSAHTGVFETGTNSSVALQQGFDPSTPFGAWLQAESTSVNGSSYPLYLNPLGGNVGIGTTAPTAELHVVGPTQATVNTNAIATLLVTGGVGGAGTGGTGGIGGSISLTAGNGGAASTGTDTGGAGGALTIAGGVGGLSGSPTGRAGKGGSLFIYGGAGAAGPNGNVPAAGNVILAATAAGTAQGNVGIGSTTPVAKLYVTKGTIGTAPSLSAHNGVLETDSSTTVALQQGFDPNSPYSAWFQTTRTVVDGTSWPIALNPLGGNVGVGTSNPTSTLDVNGGFTGKRTAVNDTAYTILSSDYIVAYTNLTAGRTATLPSASGKSGQMFIIKDEKGNAGTNNITVSTTSSQTIDGAATKVINTNYGTLRVYSDGANYFTW